MAYKDDNVTPLGAALQRWIDAHRLRGKMHESGLRGEWARIMGATVARHTEDLQLRQGVLHIRLNSGVLRNELEYSRENIRRHLNEAIGTEAIREVKLNA